MELSKERLHALYLSALAAYALRTYDNMVECRCGRVRAKYVHTQVHMKDRSWPFSPLPVCLALAACLSAQHASREAA